MNKLLILMILSGLAMGCNDDETLIDERKEESGLIESDPFDLLRVSIVAKTLKIEVSYGGGCREHIFELVWPEVITTVFPPDIAVKLTHESNDDPCFAIITETLEFDLDASGLDLSEKAIEEMRITVINGFDQNQQVSSR
ncbi:MAG: hypothetical protein AAGG59_17125 [Bacteroidota bacterium]